MKCTFMRIILLITLSFFATNVFSQQLSQLPKIRNFQKNEYRALPQSWDIVQDNQGMLYFGNNYGMLQFDGENWNIYALPNKSIIRSLLYKNDTIYVGGQGEIGFFPLVGDDKLKYHSLTKTLHEIDFEDVWNIIDDEKGGIVFHSYQSDYRYQNKVIKKIPHYKGEFLFNVNKQLLSSEDPLFHQQSFPIQYIGEDQKGNQILFTKDNGIYYFDGKNITPFYPSKVAEIKDASIYSVFPLKKINQSFHFAIGTVRNGVFIIDEKGTIKAHYNRDNGLANNTVLSMFQDRDDELWCALDNGISKIDLFSSISYYSENIDFNPSVYDANLYEDYFYIGTNQGIFKRKKDGIEHQKVKGIDDQVWRIFKWKGSLWVAHNKGLSVLKNNNFQLVFKEEGVWDGQALITDDSQLILGTYKGFRIMNASHEVSDVIEGLDVTARIFIQLNNGEIWMSHGYKGVYKCNLSDEQNQFSNVEFYNASNGLPSSIFNNVFKINNTLYVGTLKGVYNYNTSLNTFQFTSSLEGYTSNDTTHIKFLKLDQLERLWLLSERNFTTSTSDYSSVNNNFLGSFVAGFECIKELENGQFIIGMEEGYALFYPNHLNKTDKPLQTFITTLKIGNEVEHIRINKKQNRLNTISFDQNKVSFTFTNPYYKNIDYNQYRYYLEGFDKSWSRWSKKNTQNYSFLNEGEYSFMVQSKNVNNQLSAITTYSFVISPPWYRSKLAYFIYLLLFASLFTSTILFLKHRAKREKKYLMLKQANELQEMEYKLMKEVVDSKEEIVKLKNDALQSEINNKNQELAAVTMVIMQKNQGLQAIKESLEEKYQSSKDKDLKKIIKKIDEATDVENDWDEFSVRFDQVYDNFFEKLKGKYPELTHRDVQICAFLKMKLSSKEIANTLNISVRSVEQSRYRLRKKMNLNHEENLLDKILSI